MSAVVTGLGHRCCLQALDTHHPPAKCSLRILGPSQESSMFSHSIFPSYSNSFNLLPLASCLKKKMHLKQPHSCWIQEEMLGETQPFSWRCKQHGSRNIMISVPPWGHGHAVGIIGHERVCALLSHIGEIKDKKNVATAIWVKDEATF